jgi:hypothetical protein
MVAHRERKFFLEYGMFFVIYATFLLFFTNREECNNVNIKKIPANRINNNI